MERIWIKGDHRQEMAEHRKKGDIKEWYGVIAGTPVDTRMGVDNLIERGFAAVGLAASATPHEQARLQILDPQALTELVLELIRELETVGVDGIWIYCNSMCGAVNLSYLREKSTVPVVTPLDVYLELAEEYRTLGIIAANNQSLAGIERTLQTGSPHCWGIGAALLPVVLEIEAETPAGEIISRFKLAGILEAMKAMGSEALVLGCTHFPYMKKELEELGILPVIDPADRMAAMLQFGRQQE